VTSPFAYVARRGIRLIDSVLTRAYRVRAFTADAECILRISDGPGIVRKDTILPDGTRLTAGDHLVEIHFWNEHLPVIEEGGGSLLFGKQFGARLAHSLGLLAVYVAEDPAFAGFAAVHGQLGFIQVDEIEFYKRLAARFGLLLELHSAAGLRFWKGGFWAGLYAWWLIWTFNPGSLRGKRFGNVALSDLWMPRDVLLTRYGPGAPGDRG
jgi:hypothetical protein